MIAHIEGILTEKNTDSVVIDVNGVGFELFVSNTTLSNIGKTGDRVKLFTFFNVREDAMELYGFITKDEKGMFIKLKGVSGIGAKTALNVLSALSVSQLAVAIATSDAAALAKAPGIGKKTAQMIIVKLKDQIENDELVGPSAGLTPNVQETSAVGDATEALISLGYPAHEAAKAVIRAAEQASTVDEIIRIALKGMM